MYLPEIAMQISSFINDARIVAEPPPPVPGWSTTSMDQGSRCARPLAPLRGAQNESAPPPKLDFGRRISFRPLALIVTEADPIAPRISSPFRGVPPPQRPALG
jgi:hypothetical protein